MKNPINQKKLDPLLKDPALSAMLKKMVEPIEPTYGKRSNVAAPDEAILRSISDTTTASIMDTKSIFQMLPDLELAEQILISSILSPKDMITVDLQYSVAHGSMDADFAGPLLKIISDYWTRDYKINEKLEPMLSAILFHKGSFPVAILPEGSIDQMINSTSSVGKASLEALFTAQGYLNNKGLLGSGRSNENGMGVESTKASLESLVGIGRTTSPYDMLMTFDKPIRSELYEIDSAVLKDSIVVSDNYEMLRVPNLMDKIRSQRITNTLNINKFGLESRRIGLEAKKPEALTFTQAKELENSLYVKRDFKYVSAMVVPTADIVGKPTHGHPLIMELPPESVIPVFVPSDVKRHVGYFVLIDINGYPISNSQRTDYYADLSRNLTMRREVTNATMAPGNRQENAFTDLKGRQELDSLTRTYGRIVEADLLTRLKNGAIGGSVEIKAPEEVYRVMLSRTLARQKTHLLFVPAELMTYMAFDYNEFGIGVSLIEKSKVLSSMRAMLTFANTMAAVRNAAGRTNVNITLDEDDPNPIETVEQLMHSFVNSSAARFPLGASSAKDIVDFIQKAGVGMTVSGNSRYPATSMNVEDKSSQKQPVDTELQDILKKQQIMSLGLPPEAVDVGSQVEFATSLLQSNLLLAKRSMNYQRQFVNFLRDYVFKFCSNSETIISELTEAVKSKKAKIPKEVKKMFKDAENGDDSSLIDYAVAYFLDNLELSLPAADTASLEAKVVALEDYIKGLDMLLDSFLSSALYSEDNEGMIAANIDQYRECIKAHFVKLWAVQNDFMPEVFGLLEKDAEGKSAFDLVNTQGQEMTDLNNIIADFIIFMNKMKKQRDDKLTSANVALEPAEDNEFNSSSQTDQPAVDDFSFDDLNSQDDEDSLDVPKLNEEEELASEETQEEEESNTSETEESEEDDEEK